jgi:hypothetical protein
MKSLTSDFGNLSDMVGLVDVVGFRGHSGSRIQGASGLRLDPQQTFSP